jgi:RNase P/RNase MRP subunit p29
MRWPDIFFKSGKSRSTPAIVTVPSKSPEAARAPEKTELERAEAARNDQDKVESLRALAESGTSGPRAAKDSPAAKASESSNAKTAPLPTTPPQPRAATGMSLRQRAKLTEDARVLPKKEDEPAVTISKPAEDSTPKPAETPKIDAVVPAAFPVSVETGSVLDKTAENPATPVTSALETAATLSETGPSGEKPPTEPLPAPPVPSNDAASRETARVHIAHTMTSGPSTALEPVKPETRERTEFVLANGERIFGHVLSETPQTIYLDHGTLGVLTLPRSQIATKPIEVILINGDRIVGDLIAETPDCLYIKHASLGMVTVPHGQRSSRVVEAILKDGDRILGEVLAETDNFTVIRSATLGTVAVQHEQVAMLNRKIEQMQLRSLPAAAPALDDKKD